MIYVLSGGTKLYAAIGVTYPEGSTLTCTDGTKMLKAKTTTGQWVFSIPCTGTWTVTATDGTNTKSQSVEITAEGQFESVTIIYAYVLYSADTGLADGCSISGNTIRPGIDMSQYSSCKVKGKRTSGSTTAYFGFVETSNLSDFVVESGFTSTSAATKTIDIASVDVACYFSAGESRLTLEDGYLWFGDSEWEGNITSIVLYP